MKKIILVLALIVLAARTADVQIEHYEDGSGRITYCLPLADCKK